MRIDQCAARPPLSHSCLLQVSLLTSQVIDLQRSLSALQEETDTTITKLRQELQDKANIVETLQQQIRMKMFMNLTTKNPMMAALADLQGKNPSLSASVQIMHKVHRARSSGIEAL